MVETLTRLAVLLATIVGLGVGARLLVGSAVRLGRHLGLSELTIGLTVVAIGTSTPELVVTGDAALAGLGSIAVGNVVGSNIYNLAFILGVVSLLRVIPVERSLVHRDGVALAASTLLGGAALLDLTVTRVEGVGLLAAFVGYTAYLLRTGNEGRDRTDGDGGDADPTGDATAFGVRDAGLLLGGLAVVLLSGHFMVASASAIALSAGISEWVVGGTIVAAGTSTPEFAVSLVAMRRGSLGVSVGNIVGSNVFNLLAVLGIGAVLRPLVTGPSATADAAWLAAVVAFTVAALWSGRQLSRPEGGLLALSEVGRWALGLLGGPG